MDIMSQPTAVGRRAKSKLGIGNTVTGYSPTPENRSPFPNGQSASELLENLLGTESKPDGPCIERSQLLLSGSVPETKEEHSRPLVVELFAGSFGWSAGWLELGGWAVGFDIEHLPHHGPVPKGADLVIQDVLTLHGRQFKDASLLLASPPCTEFSYLAMPWSRGKKIAAALRGQGEFPEGYTGSRTIVELTALFDACFRIQREACEAAGRHIPMVVENVRGAQPWVGRSRWNFGAFHIWGDVPALMPMTKAAPKHGGDCFNDPSWPGKKGGVKHGGVKQPGISGKRSNGKGAAWFQDGAARAGSKSNARKAASAAIAKIPLPLARHIAAVWYPR